MQSLDPDLVLINTAQEYLRSSLASFGTVEVVPIYTQAGQPYHLACNAAATLAEFVGDPPAAPRLLGQAEATMTQTRARLCGYDGRPLYVVEFLDARHVAVAGHKSLFQGVFDQLGLRNAWTGEVGEWGTAVVGLEDLAANPEARVIYLTPLSEDGQRTIAESPLWQRLPFVRNERVAALPPVWPFGALPSAIRIARLLGDVLTTSVAAHG